MKQEDRRGDDNKVNNSDNGVQKGQTPLENKLLTTNKN